MTSQPGTGPRGALSSTGWAARVIPPVLLIVLTLAGLRGAITAPRWDGPLHRQGVLIGVALIAVLVTMLVLIWLRHRAALPRPVKSAASDVAAKLRSVLGYLLGGGIVAVIVTILFALHLHLFNAKPRPTAVRPLPPSRRLPGTKPVPQSGNSSFHLPLAAIFYGLLVLVLIAAIVVSILWARRLRPAARLGDDPGDEEDSADLREAVESGRSALRTFDDARAAVIVCFLAMEQSVAARGAARAVADTP